MEELYYVNGKSKDKKGCTWRELLQWCYNQINTDNEQWNRKWGFYKIRAYDRARINDFFSGWKHNNNDGKYEDGYWEQKVVRAFYDVIVGPLRPNENRIQIFRIYERVWIPPKFIPSNGWYVEDSFNRIIPSGYIKDCYLMFNPDTSKKKESCHSYRRYNETNWEFRKDPIPHTGEKRNWCGRKYAGNHGNSVHEIKYRPGYEQLQKETRDEYGVTFNISRRGLVDLDACCYHFNHRRGNKGKGWKRTRKKKQWM